MNQKTIAEYLYDYSIELSERTQEHKEEPYKLMEIVIEVTGKYAALIEAACITNKPKPKNDNN